jgi:apolipoprotein N-acyltransferase
LIAFLAGAATVLAFAPVGVFPLAIATFALLTHLWMYATPRQCFWRGFWFGLGLYGAGVSWVYVSLHTFGGMPAALAAFFTLGYCAFLALFPAAAGWLQARIPAADPVRACLLIPAAWVLFEWTLEWLFTGFPWLAIGYAAVGWPLQGYAPMGGVYLLTFTTLALGGLLWILGHDGSKLRPLIAIVALLGAGQALQTLRWTKPSGAPVSAALLQGNIEQEMKFSPQRYPAIFDAYARLAEETSAKLIVLPETALPRFYHRIPPAELARLDAAARNNGGDLMLGVPYQAGEDYYNSVVTLGVSPSQTYHKVHLVPFGEFIPPGFGWVLQILRIPLSDFSRGSPNQPPLQIAGQRVAANICYEDVFGDEMAARAVDATLLVNMSNVAWFGDSLAPAQHLQIARLRAIETGRMHLTATNTGITAAIDRDGRVVGRLPQFTEARLEVAAQAYDGVTPYMRWRDWPIVVLSLVVLAFFIIRARLSPQSNG